MCNIQLLQSCLQFLVRRNQMFYGVYGIVYVKVSRQTRTVHTPLALALETLHFAVVFRVVLVITECVHGTESFLRS